MTVPIRRVPPRDPATRRAVAPHKRLRGTLAASVVSAALVAVVAAGAPSAARAAGEIYTVAGDGRLGSRTEGVPATALALRAPVGLAGLADGGFLIADRGRVLRVDTQGVARRVAGTGRPAFTGGGSALAARITPTDVAPLADGGFLMAECANGRVRRVSPDGAITTVAGSSEDVLGDGGPAIHARLGCPSDVAPMPDGGFVIAVREPDNCRVRRVAADGVISTIAGSGLCYGGRPGEGGRATAGSVVPGDVAVAADGTVLIADLASSKVLRLTADGRLVAVAGNGRVGRRIDDGRPALAASITPSAIALGPDGSLLIADNGDFSAVGAQPRIRRVSPSGIIATVAGTGRFVPDPPRGDENRGDGGPAARADLHPVWDVAALPDGGALIAEERPAGGLVRYVTPAAPGLFAAALRRDRDRLFRPGRPPAVSVTLTAPAAIELAIEDGRRTVATVRADAGAGTTRIALPRRLDRRPHLVTLHATETSGRRVLDRFRIYPRGWLALELARLVARGLVFNLIGAGAITGDGVRGCRRFAPARVDCLLDADVILSIRLGADRRLRWATYDSPYATVPQTRQRPVRLRRRHFSCEVTDSDCPPPLAGRLSDRRLVPWG